MKAHLKVLYQQGDSQCTTPNTPFVILRRWSASDASRDVMLEYGITGEPDFQRYEVIYHYVLRDALLVPNAIGKTDDELIRFAIAKYDTLAAGAAATRESQ